MSQICSYRAYKHPYLGSYMKSLEDTHSPITANRGFYHFRSLAARHNQVTTRFAAWESAADASTTAAHTASFGIRSRFIPPTGIVRVAELGNEPAEKARQLFHQAFYIPTFNECPGPYCFCHIHHDHSSHPKSHHRYWC
jgi:hypothetical protein